MTTVADIVIRAFRKIGVGGQGEAITAEMINEGVDALNAMMHGWKLRGVDLEHENLGTGDAFSLAPEYEEGTVYLLAGRLSPDYQVPASFDADDWFRTFQMHNTTIDAVDMPVGLVRLTSFYTGYKWRS